MFNESFILFSKNFLIGVSKFGNDLFRDWKVDVLHVNNVALDGTYPKLGRVIDLL